MKLPSKTHKKIILPWIRSFLFMDFSRVRFPLPFSQLNVAMMGTNMEKDGILLSWKNLTCVFVENSRVSLEACFLFAYLRNIPGWETVITASQRAGVERGGVPLGSEKALQTYQTETSAWDTASFSVGECLPLPPSNWLVGDVFSWCCRSEKSGVLIWVGFGFGFLENQGGTGRSKDEGDGKPFYLSHRIAWEQVIHFQGWRCKLLGLSWKFTISWSYGR